MSILENIFPHGLGITEETKIFQEIHGKISVNTGKYISHCLGIIEEAEIFQDIQGKMSVNTGKYMFPLFGIGTYQ